HPGTTPVETDGTGASCGKWTCNATVAAVSLSVGTRNVNRARWPASASSGLTVTWANAGAADASTRAATAPTVAATRRTAAGRVGPCTTVTLLHRSGRSPPPSG